MTLRIDRVETSHPDARSLLARYYDELRARFGVDVAAPPDDMDESSGGAFLVAYDGATPLACGGIRRIDARCAEIKRMFVAPDARRRGLGRALLAALEDAARERGFVRIVLDTMDGHREATRLYESSGYRRVPAYNDNPNASAWFEKDVHAPEPSIR